MSGQALHIIHLRSSDLFGSPERLLLDQTRLLAAQFRFTVASFCRRDEGKALLSAAASSGIATLPIPNTSWLGPGPILALRAALRSLQPHILCTHDYKADIVGLIARTNLPVRTVAVFHGWTGESRTVRAYQALDRMALRRMQHLVAVSAANGRRLECLGIPPSRITVIPNGVAVEDYSRNPIPTERILASFGLPRDRRIIVSAGRLSAEKDQAVLLDAFRSVAAQAPDVHLVLVGDGPERGRLEARAGSLGIKDRVVFAGFRTDVAAIFHAMEFLVLSSRTEGLPMVILEAFACGKTVVATSVGGVPEVVEDQQTGLLVPPADPGRLGEAMRTLLVDRDAQSRLAARAAVLVRSRFTIERNVFAFATLFRTIASSPETFSTCQQAL